MADKNLKILLDEQDPRYQIWYLNGKAILRLDAKLAREASRLSLGLAGKQEAYANPHAIIAADALLVRTGAPFALTDGKMREEALKDAQWDSNARKGMPMHTESRIKGAESAAKVGMPSLFKWRSN